MIHFCALQTRSYVARDAIARLQAVAGACKACANKLNYNTIIFSIEFVIAKMHRKNISSILKIPLAGARLYRVR